MFASPSSPRTLRFGLSSSMVSAITHFIVILVLAFITISTEQPLIKQILQAQVTDPLEQIEDIPDDPITPVFDAGAEGGSTSVIATLTAVSMDDTPVIDPSFADADVTTTDIDVAPPEFISETTAKRDDLTRIAGGLPEGEFSGRQKGAGFVNSGKPGSPQDSAIVEALKWLAEHQNADGSWNFDHRGGVCRGRCGNPGDLVDCKTGATALGLLPFLGAGQTHREGRYQKNVAAALQFLVNEMKVQQRGSLLCGDLAQSGGNMYSHGLAATALCEAYGMTQDRNLAKPAQLALNHIVYAQDPVGGGWRYQPRTPGDTSVVGWQLMALKSGYMSYLDVPKETIVGASKFLDSVQSESGARYGYTNPGGGSGTTAAGLLCRMYLGWKKDHPGIERGVEFLSRSGPSQNNLYYNYYATQVQLHYGGKDWDEWNKKLDQQLIASQDQNAHQKGSWMITGDHGSNHGGRLYCTSLATLILEARFRISPIYKAQAAEEDFPL